MSRRARFHHSPFPVQTQTGDSKTRVRRGQRPLVVAAFRLQAKPPSETCIMSWETATLRRCCVGTTVFSRVGPSMMSHRRGSGSQRLWEWEWDRDPGRVRIPRRPRMTTSHWTPVGHQPWPGTYLGQSHPDFFGGLLSLFLRRGLGADVLKAQQWVGCGGRAPHTRSERDPESWCATARPKGMPPPDSPVWEPQPCLARWALEGAPTLLPASSPGEETEATRYVSGTDRWRRTRKMEDAK